MDTTSNADLFQLLRQLAGLTFDGEPLHVVIERGGRRVELTIGPIVAAAAAVEAWSSRKMNDSDLTILQAVAELGGAPTGAEIAEVAGYPYDAYVKNKLSGLRSAGFLSGQKGEFGNRLTDAGRAALSAGGPKP